MKAKRNYKDEINKYWAEFEVVLNILIWFPNNRKDRNEEYRVAYVAFLFFWFQRRESTHTYTHRPTSVENECISFAHGAYTCVTVLVLESIIRQNG